MPDPLTDAARPDAAQRALIALAFCGAWALVILLFALQLRYANGLVWADALSRAVLDRGPWAVLSPGIVALAWWTHARRFSVGRTVLAHALGMLVTLFLAEALVQDVFLRFFFPWRIAAPLPLERADGQARQPPAARDPGQGLPADAWRRPGPIEGGRDAPDDERGPDADPRDPGPPRERFAPPGRPYPPERLPAPERPYPPERPDLPDRPYPQERPYGPRGAPEGDRPAPDWRLPPRPQRQGFDATSPAVRHAVYRPLPDAPWVVATQAAEAPRRPRLAVEGPPEFAPGTPRWWRFSVIALRKGYNGIPLYLLIAALSHAWFFWRNLREREARVSELEERLTVARADMLRLQLEPHFLFNTLNAIGTLVYRDAALADDLIARLSTLLRRLLDLRDEHTIALEQELETVRAYVGIEQARFGERLKFEEEIAPEVRQFPIPVLLLQPLAENAVRHGIEPLGRPGTLRIAAAMRGGMLDILVEDDGVGLTGPAGGGERAGFGLGLASARVRLQALYGSEARIVPQPRLGGGTRIEIRLPKKLAIRKPDTP